MIDIGEKKEKITKFLESSGPSLPVQIARTIGMDPIFASAILSELLGEKQIKLSHMRIGSSPLYLIPGQEQKLEEHSRHLKSIEKEAYLRLKKEGLLKDEDEAPSIRVALRNLKDFAIPFKFNDKIMWRYTFTPEEEIEKMLSPSKKPVKRETEKKEKPKEKKIEKIFEPKAERPEFLTEIIDYLKEKGIKFLEEIQTEKKEIVAKINVPSNLGDTDFLLVAKNKKTISKDEIKAAVQRATYSKMPCLLIIRREPSKTIRKLINENHLVKLEVVENP